MLTSLYPHDNVSGTDYHSKNQPILPPYDGEQSDIMMRLPAGKTVR